MVLPHIALRVSSIFPHNHVKISLPNNDYPSPYSRWLDAAEDASEPLGTTYLRLNTRLIENSWIDF